ncbi:adenosine deaminase [Vibrio sp. F74]|uniref:adenosine deaminase n=1 Tax=Vibrio sp. F74 TaxID=700020 RepID=UPI0035F54F28
MDTKLPKVVLHEHIEGTVTPKMALVLAEKYSVTLPANFIYQEGKYSRSEFPNGRYNYNESDFGAFVTTYDTVAALVRAPEDYYLIVKDYLSRNAEKGLVYCEIITSAFHLCYTEQEDGSGELDSEKYHQIMDAVERAIAEVKALYGTETRLQACGVRHLSLKHLNLSADFIQQQPRTVITGFNIAGNELAGTFSDFTYVHELVDQIPLDKSYHAGEICGPDSIRQALKYGAKRIGHGIAAIKDEALIETLICDNITLEIAPTSNRILVSELNQSLEHHPLRKLYEKGVRLSINTDDAGLFGTDIGKEYHIAETQFGFTKVELLDVTLCALEAAFVENDVRDRLIKQTYREMKEQDWQDLTALCTALPQGALQKRLANRLQFRP